MSGQSVNGSDRSFDIEEIKTRCRALRKEKDALRDTQSQSFELIRGLELHVKTLSEAHMEDKKRIQDLKRELSNCSQEIDYLQDQLKAKNTRVNCLVDHVSSLELKLAQMQILEDTVDSLREQLEASDSERLFLIEELERKEEELETSTSCVEKLEELKFSIGLEYQCEIESLKLELMTLEQRCFEAKKLQEETSQENSRMKELIRDYELQFQEAQKVIEYLDEENRKRIKKLEKSEANAIAFCKKMEEKFQQWIGNTAAKPFSNELEEDTRICGSILGPLLSRLVVLGETDADLKDETVKMSNQIHEYELLVTQLKEELREEKSKAKEEAEDLVQEMAELRYQITGLLEEECKRRACVEHISLQRIAELEAQIKTEQRKSCCQEKKAIATIRLIQEA